MSVRLLPLADGRRARRPLQGDGVSSLPSVTEASVPTEAETQLTRKLERRPWPTQT